jgi:hypothetical protein
MKHVKIIHYVSFNLHRDLNKIIKFFIYLNLSMDQNLI